MKNWQFWLIMVGLMQIHYDLNKSEFTLIVTWLLVGVSLHEAWKERRA